jgi:formate dehydrogenase subunit delta
LSASMNTELQHLIKMINQIADNVAMGESVEQAAAKVADHLRRFWAPSMRQQIFDYVDTGGAKLKAVSRAAIIELRSG